MEKIGSLLLEFDSASMRHVHREGNFATDFLSHTCAYNFERGVHVLEKPPTGLAIWLLHDRLGISYDGLCSSVRALPVFITKKCNISI